MIGEDIAFDRIIGDDALITAFARLFGIPRDAIRLVETIADAPPPSDRTVHLVLERWTTGGEFPLTVRLYPRDDLSLEPVAAVQRICADLQAAALLADESREPTAWLRVRPDGQIDHVRVADEALERDELVIVEAKPGSRKRRVA